MVSVVPCQVDRLGFDFDGAGVQIDFHLARADHRLRVASRTPDDRMEPCDQLAFVESFCQVVVGAEHQALDLVVRFRHAGQDQNGRLDLGHAESLKNLVAMHVRQVEVENDDVVVVKLSEIDTLFAKIGRVDVKAFHREHHVDASRRGLIVLYQKHSHRIGHPLMCMVNLKVGYTR